MAAVVRLNDCRAPRGVAAVGTHPPDTPKAAQRARMRPCRCTATLLTMSQVYGNVHWLALRRGHEMVSPPEGGAHVCHFRYRWRHTFERRQRKGYLAATTDANATQASRSLGGFSARHRKHKSWVVAQWRSSLFHMWSPSCRGMHRHTRVRTHIRTHTRTHARTHARRHARTYARARARTYNARTHVDARART